MSEAKRAPAPMGRIGVEGGIFAVVGALAASYIPSWVANPEQMVAWEYILIWLCGAIGPIGMSALRNAGHGGALTGADPLRSNIGVDSTRSIALVSLLIFLPLFMACKSVQNLTPTGQFDLAKSTAVDVVEELEQQARFVIDDRIAGRISHETAVTRFEAISTAQASLEDSILIATIAFQAGEPPGELAANLATATGAARTILRGTAR